uniref:Uncharacterized protein n=1 Tax=Mycena chlorophos TaxID=658473 RepID=A0ABQ0LVB5_MYCCL|nr:predicted protein [Mycena chlorophos]
MPLVSLTPATTVCAEMVESNGNAPWVGFLGAAHAQRLRPAQHEHPVEAVGWVLGSTGAVIVVEKQKTGALVITLSLPKRPLQTQPSTHFAKSSLASVSRSWNNPPVSSSRRDIASVPTFKPCSHSVAPLQAHGSRLSTARDPLESSVVLEHAQASFLAEAATSPPE